jgi:hypothetical protein
MAGLPTLNDKTLEETLRMIDNSSVTLLAMKSRRNDLLPISRLPPEIMCRIFSLAQIPSSLVDKPNPLEWITLTYVCRRWRNIAVNSPSLWVAPPMGYRKWVEEMLRRSKESSLVIISDTDRIDSGIVSALQQIHRIRQLSLENLSWDSWNILREMFPKSVPQLESLCLKRGVTPYERSPPWTVDPGPLIIPENILCETGRLSQLELENCHLNWNSQSHLLRSLTHLTLSGLPQTSLPTAKQFASALKSMPELEALKLWNSFPIRAEQQSSWGSENIHLAHLHTLSIASGFVEGEAFFSKVSFPPTAMVELVLFHYNSRDYPNYPDMSGAIFALARSYANTTPDTAFHSIVERGVGRNGIRLRFFTEKFDIYEIASTVSLPRLDLELICGNTESPATNKLLIDIFNSGIPLHNVGCVYLPESTLWGLKTETIAHTFGMLPYLHSVVAAGKGATSFFNAMHLDSQAGDAAGPDETPIRKLYFPCVSSIALHDATFMEANPHYPGALTKEMCHNILIQRRELGGPIETLLFRNCIGIFEEDTEWLEEVVVNIDCDVYDKYVDEDPEDEEGEEGTEEDEEEEADGKGEDEDEDDE